MKTLVKGGYIWKWSDETVENLKNKNFHQFDGCFVKRDFLITENKKILLNFNVEKEKVENVINLNGKYCLPGLIDAHIHLGFISELSGMCNLSECKSAEEVIEALQQFEREREQEKKKEKEPNETVNGVDDAHEVDNSSNFICAMGFKSLCTTESENSNNSENAKASEIKLNRYILDKYFKDKCILILSTCVHYIILNSKALEYFGLLSYEQGEKHVNVEYFKNDEAHPQEQKKEGINDAGNQTQKHMTGVLYEQLAQEVYFRMVNECFPPKKKMKIMQGEMDKLTKTGLTCIQTCDKNMANLYKKLEEENKLNIRIFLTEFNTSIFEYLFNHYKIDTKQKSDVVAYKELMQKVQNDKHRKELETQLKEHFCINDSNINLNTEETHQKNPLFNGNRIKFFCDGSLGGKTCATYYPFKSTDTNLDNTTQKQDISRTKAKEISYGLISEPLTLSNRIRTANLLNLRMDFHCIGDRSADFLLNELMHINKNCDRFVIVHAQLVNDNVIQKVKALNIILCCQPSFLSSDYKYIKNYIHSAYYKYCYLYKSLLNQNIVIAGSSDAPIESYAPLIGIFDCMFRNITKVLPLSYIEAFYKKQELVQKMAELEETTKNIQKIINNCYEESERLSFSEALAIYTITPAYMSKTEFFNEANKIKLGAICDDAEADFVVIDRDISKNSEINILNCRICQTWVAGKIRYQNDNVTQ